MCKFSLENESASKKVEVSLPVQGPSMIIKHVLWCPANSNCSKNNRWTCANLSNYSNVPNLPNLYICPIGGACIYHTRPILCDNHKEQNAEPYTSLLLLTPHPEPNRRSWPTIKYRNKPTYFENIFRKVVFCVSFKCTWCKQCWFRLYTGIWNLVLQLLSFFLPYCG